jgi:hypothetical protein
MSKNGRAAVEQKLAVRDHAKAADEQAIPLVDGQIASSVPRTIEARSKTCGEGLGARG